MGALLSACQKEKPLEPLVEKGPYELNPPRYFGDYIILNLLPLTGR